MNNNKIQNPVSQVPKTPQMNDRDFVNDMLLTEKYMTDGYSTALNEMSHEGLYQDIKTLFNETQDCQHQLFYLMFKKGWYSMAPAQSQHIQQDVQKFSNYAEQQFPPQ
ncbi:MAG TPA: spore coat protein [Bacillales bacterium]|nr:spore coat protein [Bacillales bacterium]